ncbi:HAMP domain-containing histidine kinase [Halorussus salilacus]|uniref:sensor histidine kinase n=1 Tax=Halorussus salilacus TaxID=2953750 RepID=UPI00209E3E04|nr:HAMP domain-containing sensor histidine kinase [Halorussus salilacus]USZ68431.1 HAMP domain-containing histidine kinase [Halorussus salilacus]
MVSRLDASSASEDALALREWLVVGLGASLLAVSVSYLVAGSDSLASEFVRLSVPIALSLFLVALGVWVRATGIPSDVVAVWSVAGAVVMGLIAGWVSLLQSMQGRPMLQPAYIVLTEVGLGAVGGGLLGVYYGRVRQRTEQLAEQRNRLDEFASIVSHDLRNPMNVAQGHLELARETGEERHFEAVEGAHERMERLVDEVPALSRRGETVEDPTPVDLDAVAREAWATVETPGMVLHTEVDATVVSDGRRLRALFENLFRNAAEHGGDEVTVGSLSGESAPDSKGFYVADDGPGIPADDRERIFEGGYSTRTDGTGFGLAIVRRIAEAHDWRIRVTESQSGGARFEFVDAGDE